MTDRPTRSLARPLRFLLSGALNTALTYLLYLALLLIASPAVAYTIAYLTGIALAYVLNRLFVFRAHSGVRTAVLFPLVYVLQYVVSMVIVTVWVDVLHMDARVAPLIAIGVTLPITYVSSRRLFVGQPPSP